MPAQARHGVAALKSVATPPIPRRRWLATSTDNPSTMLSDARFLTHAPRDLSAWSALFDPTDLPVLASTAEVLVELALNEDAVDAHMLADAIVDDPLMTIKVLSHVAQLRRGRDGSDTETVTESLVMLGIPPFFRAFAVLPVVEDLLADRPEHLAGFRRVLRRARRAARFAMGFAVHRMDHDAAVLHEAALLHDFAELLLWLRAPALAVAIEERQAADPALRSAVVQREVLHIELEQLEHALMTRWRLPALLVQISDGHARHQTAQMRNVQLALRVARHSALDWNNAALPDDLAAIAELLNVAPDAANRLLRDIDDGYD
jgi:HD-like signal output (HDOD) protein